MSKFFFSPPLNKLFNFGIILDVQGNCKDSTDSSQPVSLVVNILHYHLMCVKTKKSTLIHYYWLCSRFFLCTTSLPMNVLTVLEDPIRTQHWLESSLSPKSPWPWDRFLIFPCFSSSELIRYLAEFPQFRFIQWFSHHEQGYVFMGKTLQKYRSQNIISDISNKYFFLHVKIISPFSFYIKL